MITPSNSSDLAYAISRIEVPTTLSRNTSDVASSLNQGQSWQLLPNTVFENVLTHSAMLKRSVIEATSTTPISYTQYHSSSVLVSANASGQSGANLLGYYDDIDKQLDRLLDDEDDSVEQEAVSSARQVLAYIRQYELPPPMISSHGGDAVVMLWALGDMTSAITITDGEIGYVVRKHRKLVRIEHSLAIDKYLVGREMKLL